MKHQRPVGVCLIGSGRAGMIHGVNFKSRIPKARLVAVVDPNEGAAKRAGVELEIEKYYLNYEDALNDKEIDAVVIASPTVTHRDIVVSAAKAGKHILCEKPMAITEAECKEMIEVADQQGIRLLIGFMRRFDDAYRRAKQVIDKGEIGDVVLVKSLTRGPTNPQPWTYDIAKSNGPLAEVNSHDIDTLRWFTGSEFESVFALGGNYRCRGVQTEFPAFYDNVIMNARFRNGMQGSIDGAVYVKYGYDARVEILGTDGVVFLGQVREGSVVVCTHERGVTSPIVNSWQTLFKDAYVNEATHFVNCILEVEEPVVTGVDGLMAVKVVAAGNRSIAENKIVTLDG